MLSRVEQRQLAHLSTQQLTKYERRRVDNLWRTPGFHRNRRIDTKREKGEGWQGDESERKHWDTYNTHIGGDYRTKKKNRKKKKEKKERVLRLVYGMAERRHGRHRHRFLPVHTYQEPSLGVNTLYTYTYILYLYISVSFFAFLSCSCGGSSCCLPHHRNVLFNSSQNRIGNISTDAIDPIKHSSRAGNKEAAAAEAL